MIIKKKKKTLLNNNKRARDIEIMKEWGETHIIPKFQFRHCAFICLDCKEGYYRI
jgi:hypothetical protein